ncbi:unnamed protein product [Larinioides sclopetarius]|uniref:Uncharacterized protein n=1 Tax=Larinioides sclopetarius TaxID=280406 RepID=A0AAV2BMW8_9ARAC
MATTMCLQHKPVTVAVVCVNLAAKWAQIQVQNNQQDGESWFSCADPTLSGGTLEKLTNELQNAVVKAAKKTNAPIFNCVLADSVVKGVSLSRNNKRPRCSDENTEIKVKIPRKIVCL